VIRAARVQGVICLWIAANAQLAASEFSIAAKAGLIEPLQFRAGVSASDADEKIPKPSALMSARPSCLQRSALQGFHVTTTESTASASLRRAVSTRKDLCQTGRRLRPRPHRGIPICLQCIGSKRRLPDELASAHDCLSGKCAAHGSKLWR